MPRKKVALMFVCLNEPQWPFFYQVIGDARKFFLKEHDVDFLLWSDIPKDVVPAGVKLFPTDSVGWPYPTLMRYHLFLQQEEVLNTYDYVFYMDSDMKIVDEVKDEIMGEGLTMAEHPMY